MGESKRRPLAGRRSVLLGMAGFASAALTGCTGTGAAPESPGSNVGSAKPTSPRTGPATPPPSIAAISSEQAVAALAPTTPAGPGRIFTAPSKQQIVAEFARRQPREWGLHVTGVVNRSPSAKVALTFDACGGHGGNGCDHALLKTLRRLNVPATLFINSRWIHANPALSAELAADPLYELANHGTAHLPLSVNGRAAYGIQGTATVAAEVGRVAAGDIVISHFNRPAAGTAIGYAQALPRLLDHGLSFARLGDVLTL